jgi:hypothetical protein
MVRLGRWDGEAECLSEDIVVGDVTMALSIDWSGRAGEPPEVKESSDSERLRFRNIVSDWLWWTRTWGWRIGIFSTRSGGDSVGSTKLGNTMASGEYRVWREWEKKKVLRVLLSATKEATRAK